MAAALPPGKLIQKLESETATIHMSGVASPGNNSDSDSEPELPPHTRPAVQHDQPHSTKRSSSTAANNEKITKTQKTEDQNTAKDTGSSMVIAQIMIDSSDSGCALSPVDETPSGLQEQKQKDTTDNAAENFSKCETSGHDTDTSPIKNTTQSTKEHEKSMTNSPDEQDVHTEKNKDETEQMDSPTQENEVFSSETNLTMHERDLSSTETLLTSSRRINPFNSIDGDDQDPFPQLTRESMSSSVRTLKENQRSESPDSWANDEDVTQDGSGDSGYSNVELGMTEDYFSQPEGHFGALSIDEMEEIIASCRKMVLEAPAGSDQRKNLVHKLVHLRLKLSEAKEEQVTPDAHIKQVVGHSFSVRDMTRSRRYCEQCNSVIWGVLHAWYRCNTCGFCCHEKCLDLVSRACAIVKIRESAEYNLSICPEKPLSSINYKCGECRTKLSFHSGQGEPRLCDYTGSFYCDRCHWNDVMIIPSRVLHNWDFEPRKVCRGTKQFLRLMRVKAVLRVQDINPMLFNFVEELNDVKKLREEILIMKKYFMSCKDALQSKLLLQLQERQHFVENSDMYSLQDLCDVAQDVLLPELAKIHASFAQHIKTDCELCRGQGYVCELCDDHDVLFPFDNIAIVCSLCSTVLHRHCYMRRNQKCPKCTRLGTRTD